MVIVNYASTINETDIDDAPDLLVDPIASPSGEDTSTVKTLSKPHDIEKGKVVFDNY